jgi:hypothetical protein
MNSAVRRTEAKGNPEQKRPGGKLHRGARGLTDRHFLTGLIATTVGVSPV